MTLEGWDGSTLCFTSVKFWRYSRYTLLKFLTYWVQKVSGEEANNLPFRDKRTRKFRICSHRESFSYKGVSSRINLSTFISFSSSFIGNNCARLPPKEQPKSCVDGRL